MKKLDLKLQVLLQQRCGTIGALDIGQPVPGPDGRIDVIVSFRGDVNDLKPAGFLLTSVTLNPSNGGVATGKILVDNLDALTRIDNVIQIGAAQPMWPLLNYSAVEIRARMAQQPNPTAYLGNGVVVGIIDTGFEPRHGSFYDETTLKTRVIALWDQFSTASDGAPAPNPIILAASTTPQPSTRCCRLARSSARRTDLVTVPRSRVWRQATDLRPAAA
jgi:subtilisin family serine protease